MAKYGLRRSRRTSPADGYERDSLQDMRLATSAAARSINNLSDLIDHALIIISKKTIHLGHVNKIGMKMTSIILFFLRVTLIINKASVYIFVKVNIQNVRIYIDTHKQFL